MDTLFYHGQGHEDENYRNTFAGRFEGDDLVLGIALCSKKDKFFKSFGRKVAEDRINLKRRGFLIISLEENAPRNSATFVRIAKDFDKLTRSEKITQFNITRKQ